jgi:penicillin-binding protein 2
MVRNEHSRFSMSGPDGSQDRRPRIDWRLLMIQLIAVTLFVILLAQLWRLQIVEGHSFRQLADINRFRVSPVEAPRGIIYDRNHQILASNTPSFTVTVVPAALPKDDPGGVSRVYADLGQLLSMTPADIEAKINNRKGDDFTPVSVKSDVNRDVVMRVEEKHLKLPGVLVVPESSRLYPFGALTSHILGYMLPITEEDLAAKQADPEAGYQAYDKLGATGVEAAYENELRGKPGKKLYEVDATERPVADLRVDGPDPGHNLTLTLDVNLQRDVEKILQAGMKKSLYAVAIVMDPRNDQILAMVSTPSYDNNLFAAGIRESDLQNLLNDPRKPMIDYAIGGTFPPGSTFKLVTSAGALQEGIANANTVIDCPGYLMVPNQYNPALSQRLADWGAFGKLNFVQGLADSSDVYFYTLGGGTPTFPGLGNDRLATYANFMGYGAPTGIDLPGEVSGLIPTNKWKQATWAEQWLTGDTYNMSIGQGFVLATPLQVANATNAIANGGHLLKPQIVAGISDSEDQLIKTIEPQEIRRIPVDQQNLDLINQGMQAVVRNTIAGENLAPFNVPELKVAGKTGTAEYAGPKDANGIAPTHGWFTAFAPYDNPQVSVTVFLQSAGSSDAVPVAMDILKRYFHYTPSSAPSAPTSGQGR